MTPPAHTPEASARHRLGRLLALLFPVLACIVLSQQAVAQTSDVTVNIADASFGEGDGTVTLMVTLSAAIGQDVVVGLFYVDGTATRTDDLHGDPPLPGFVTIRANNLSGSFTIRIRNDTVDEPTETFSIFLNTSRGDLPPGVVFGKREATITIVDNDDPPFPVNNRVSIVDPQPILESAGALNFVVSAGSNVRSDVVLGVAYAGGTTNPATPADDLGPDRPSTVTIAEGQRRATLRVPIVNDDIVEENETFTVTLSLPAENPLGHILHFDGGADTTTATGTIENDDEAPEVNATVSIDDASVAENGGNAEFTVRLTQALDSAVTLAVAYTAGTATLATDLGTRPDTVTITANTTEATLLVPIANDNIVEGNEDFTVTISEGTTPLPEGVTIGTANTATGTITEDDEAEVTLGPARLSAAEGETFTYTVSLSAPADEAVTVRWTATAEPGDTASLTDDVGSPQTGTVTFGADTNTDQTFTIATIEDTAIEGDETFTVTLGPDTPGGNPLPTGVSIGTNNSSTATITNDDTATADLVAVREVAETANNLTFRVDLDRTLTEDVTLSWEVTGGTASAADFDADYAATGMVTIPSGQGFARIQFGLVDDVEAEGTETLVLTISSPPPGVTIGTATATGTITDDDNASPTLNLRAVRGVIEGAARLTFRVDLNTDLADDVTVSWAVTGGTASAADFNDSYEASGAATITSGRRTVPIHFVPIVDGVIEGDETLELTISSPPSGVTIGTATATGTITDDADDTPLVNATVSIDDASVAENGGNAEFTVRLTAAVSNDVTLAVAYAAGTANLATDLGTRPDTVTIDQGQTSAILLVPISNDNIVEGNEDFTVTISEGDTPLPDGVTIGTGNTATGTITEDDAAEVTLSTTTPTAAENGTFTYTVTLSAPADEAVTVRWTATDGTATVADDLQAITDTVTFNAGSNTNQTFDIAVNDDDLDEDNETFTVTLEVDNEGGNPLPTGVSIGANNSATGTIIDNDDTPVVNATVSIGNANVAENGGNAEFTVSLTTAVDSDVVLAVAYTAGTATLAIDLGTRPTTVTIDQGQTSATLLVPIVNDNIVEGNEDFTVTISEGTTPLPDGVTIGTANTATGTIEEDDEAEITLGPATLSASEGETFTYTVSLSAPADEAVTVRWTATDGTATVDDELQAPHTNTVTFDANDNTAQEFTISPVDDNDDEDNETFTVTLEVDTQGGNALPTGVSIGTSNTSASTITDDDDPVAAPTVDVSIDDASAAEGATIRFAVTLSAELIEARTLNVAYTAGSASLDDLGSDRPTTLTLPTGTTTVNLAVPTVDDDLVEESESFTVTLSPVPSDPADPPPANTLFLSDPEATGTITDNDEAPGDDAMVRIGDVTVGEGAGNAAFKVTLSRAVSSAVVLDVTYADGTAEVATDLGTPLPPTVTIDADTTEATVAVPIVDDDSVEDAETFTVTLSENRDTQLPDGVTIADGEATGTITDNDDGAPPPPGDDALVSIAATTGSAEEGQTLAFAVRLSRAVDAPMTIRWTAAGGTATLRGPSSDLAADAATTGTVAFVAGDTAAKRFTIATRADDLVEGNETLEVRIAAVGTLPEGVAISPTASVARATITETVAAAVSIAPSALSRMEGDGFTFAVRLEHRVTRPVAVRWTAAGGTATLKGSGSDLEDGQETSGTVSIAAGARQATFTIDTREDTEVEADETFTVTIAAADTMPAGVSMGGTANRATATILNDDVATELSIDDASVIEGGMLRFPYTLSEAVDSTVSLTYATADGTATVANADYTPATDGLASIPANTTEGVIEVPTTADEFVEANETLTLLLIDIERADNGVVSFINEVATGTIVNDDFAEVSIAPSEVSAAEGRTLVFEVRLDKAVDEEVTVSWTAAGAGGNPATLSGETSDLEPEVATRDTVTFAARDTEPKPLAIASRADTLVEGDETFEVRLAADSLPAAVNLDTDPATGTIADLTSALIEPRRSGAATALRRHVGRFETMTSAVVRGRLGERAAPGLRVSGNLGHPRNDGNFGDAGNFGNAKGFGSHGNYGNAGNFGNPGNYGNPGNFGNSENFGNGTLMIGGGFAETGLGAWTDGAYTGFRGRATGRQADVYAGVDYLGGNGNWLIGALVGQEFAELDAGGASYRANYTQVGAYGGARLSQRLLFDGAATYGIATPEVRQGDVSASYEASRITLRAGLTGDVGLAYGLGDGRVTIAPQVNVSWARERLGGFTDSAGRVAPSEILELGRLGAGPRVTWDIGGSQLVGGVQLQWDFVQPDDIAEELSTVVDIGLQFALSPGIKVGLAGDVDGIGIADDFLTFGGGLELQFNLARNIAMSLFGDVDGIGTLDAPPYHGGRFEITIGR